MPGMTSELAEIQRLRAFITARKRGIEAAEKRYLVQDALVELRELAAPLLNPERFSPLWKSLYLKTFYRDITSFLLGFVAIHLEVSFTAQDREQAFDVFFDRAIVPSSKAIGALVSSLSAMTTMAHTSDQVAEEDVKSSINQCIRLLEKAVNVRGLQNVVSEMLLQEQQSITNDEQSVIGLQVLISQLVSLPDLVHNRHQRNTPEILYPRQYFTTLCDCLFHSLSEQENPNKQSRIFRMFADKLARTGQAKILVQSWMRSFDSLSHLKMNACLFQSLPESSYEQILFQIANEKTLTSSSAKQALRLSKYRLLAQIPPEMCANKHFQYVVAHKLLLRKPIEDFFFWRVLADVMVEYIGNPSQSPLITFVDVLITRWSQSDFSVSTEYTLNASVCFFLRYALQKLSKNGVEKSCIKQDWITKLCKGVQDHMSHSLLRVRTLGMRVGESLSHVIASEKPLDFGLEDEDPLAVYGCPVFPEEVKSKSAELTLDECFTEEASPNKRVDSRRTHPKICSTKPYTLDPDELVLSDDGGEEDLSETSFDDAESDSDMSLEAYDLKDDEEDLTAKRPLYLKDLIANLLSDDDREKIEVALHEAELLLRRQPRDLKDKAHDVVRAFLRLENKYNTKHFVPLRLQALATTCALAPTQTLPYLCNQALEREQLLQSRIDVLQAMTLAAQELSERGGGCRQSHASMTLLQEQVEDGLNTRTMQSLKTRRWGYRRDPLAAPKRNLFAPYALAFFSPLLFGYVAYTRKYSSNSGSSRREVEQTFLAHLLHALANFVECAKNSPQTVAMAKCLLDFAWSERSSSNAEVRRQVLFSLSRVLLVVPPALLRQEVGETLAEIAPWLRQVQNYDLDAGCREAARMLSSFAAAPEAFV